jgi:hypothetical protein
MNTQASFTDGTHMWRFRPPGTLHEPERLLESDVDFAQQGYYYSLGPRCLLDHPMQLLLNLKNIWRLFFGMLYPTFESQVGWLQLFALFDATLLMLLVPLSIIAVYLKRDSRYVLFGFLLLSLFPMVWLQAPAERRYLIPVEPFLILLAAIGGEALSEPTRTIRFTSLKTAPLQ